MAASPAPTSAGGAAVALRRRRRETTLRVVVERHGVPGLDLRLPDGRTRVQVVVGAATLLDLVTGEREVDGTRVLGPAVRAAVRDRAGAWACAAVVLPPLALTGPGRDPRAVVPVGAVLTAGVAELVEAALVAGDDERAGAILREDVAGLLRGADDARAGAILHDDVAGLLRDADDDVERFADVLAHIEEEQGLVTAAEVARAEGATVSDLFRWSDRLLGMPAADYVAAVRFTAFVREAVGTAAPSPRDVLAALRWYDATGQPPREVARLTGLEVRDLHRLVARLAAALDPT